MRQYTTPEQTAKLIELGFEKPGSIASVEPIYGMGGISVAKAYSIGELIEMLDKVGVTTYIRFGAQEQYLFQTIKVEKCLADN